MATSKQPRPRTPAPGKRRGAQGGQPIPQPSDETLAERRARRRARG